MTFLWQVSNNGAFVNRFDNETLPVLLNKNPLFKFSFGKEVIKEV